MKTVVDEQLALEADRFTLRFACEDCAHFSPPRSACVHGYPTLPHRRVVLRAGAVVTFCKEFELSEAADEATSS